MIKDPVDKVDCITISEFILLYNHGLGDNCESGEGGANTINFNFNFFGDAYGITGISSGQTVNYNVGPEGDQGTNFLIPGDAPFCIDCNDDTNPGTALASVLPSWLFIVAQEVTPAV